MSAVCAEQVNSVVIMMMMIMHGDDVDDKDDVDDDQEVCPLENDNSTLIMVLGGETARENRENEHSTSIGNNHHPLL